ncbi:outer membrane lipoprotein-sorting protein, partial [Enterovibrio norvegicus]
MKTMRTLSKAVVIAFSMMAMAAPVTADEVKGLEIAKERKVRDQG